ncbi:MAG: calcium/sodium antiporter [Gammaproteobacteria bacterium]|nr:MAG: calcium/sodium antiporter [Gammaproteobacteria bacterium]
MNDLLLFALAVAGGFALLVGGAERFIYGSSAIAINLGISPLIIGLTVVGFGTSAPEMLISGVSSWSGNPGIAVGNAIGSNIANIALVLGITALIMPLSVHSDTLRREFPVLLAVTLLTLLLLADGDLSRVDGILLFTGMLVMIYLVVKLGLQTRQTDPMKAEYSVEIPQHIPMGKAIFWTALGLLVLLASSKMVVWGAIGIARAYGVSDLVIGLTIVAFGTSLPELAASIISACKKEHDIAIGNIIGSNMFNLLGVLAIPGLIHPTLIEQSLLERDLPIMIALTIALFAMAYGFGRQSVISRVEGATLLLSFFGYLGIIYIMSV